MKTWADRPRDEGGRFLPGTRAAALDAGEAMYFTGRPCPRGHVAPRFVSNFGCQQCLLEGARSNHQKNRESRLARYRQYAKQKPGENRERSSAARYGGTRVPCWADRAAIQAFYAKCPEGMTVDHVVPLKGRNVSGLHVLENLQYVTLKENSRKGASFSG